MVVIPRFTKYVLRLKLSKHPCQIGIIPFLKGSIIIFFEEKQLRNVLYFLVSANCDNDGNYLNGELDLLSTKLIVYKQKGEMKIRYYKTT